MHLFPVAGSILPHCSKAVNTFAAACQAAVKYCLCSFGLVSKQLKTAMRTGFLMLNCANVEYINKGVLLFVECSTEYEKGSSMKAIVDQPGVFFGPNMEMHSEMTDKEREYIGSAHV